MNWSNATQHGEVVAQTEPLDVGEPVPAFSETAG
jgi:hypothetical protein